MEYQAHDSMMYEYFCIEFIYLWLKAKVWQTAKKH